MGDSDWQEVNRRKRRSVFERLNPSQTQKSNVDDLARISLSVVNSDNLIHSLSNIWIGKMRLHANVARFGRNVDVKPFHAGVKASTVDGKKGSKVVDDDCGDHIPVVDLKQSTSNDFPLAVLGCYKDFRSIANARSFCHSEGFLDVNFKYLGRLWLLFEFKSQKVKNKFLNHKGILSWFSSLKSWHDDFIVEERLVWLEIEVVPIRAWKMILLTLFVTNELDAYLFGDDSDRDEEGSMGIYVQEKVEGNEENDVVSVKGIFDDNGEDHTKVDEKNHNYSVKDSYHEEGTDVDLHAGPYQENSHHDDVDSGPFGLASLINKKSDKDVEPQSSVTPEFPPGFSSSPNNDQHANHTKVQDFVQPPVSESSHTSLGKPIGFSMLEILEETIKIDSAMGLNMEACENTLAFLIANNGELKGNIHFDFASMSAKGMSGGIWILYDVRIMWIAVYAPQLLHGKIALWSSLTNLIANWDGILVALGDFNVVKEAGERFGLIFNERHAELFNAFISNASLIDVPLGGFYDTFPHITGVVLEKGSPDHRPILLKEHSVDYGILNDGEWIEDLDSVKDVFRERFRNRFQHTNGIQPTFDVDMLNHLSCDQSEFLEHDFSREEIKRDVWDCGGNRASGLDGFTFKFFTTFWDLLEADVIRFVQAFFLTRSIPKGCNSSFIDLIPKVSNATIVTDFLPISLIGFQYKIIGKVLANL
ncbi:RNA-directed DNA polymerase, eukaryota, reverse transcriptase zinc-binding domain protein [Tanacetum coccineum]